MSSKILELLRKIDEASSRQECFSVQRLTDDLRVLLAAPVVERQPVPIQRLSECDSPGMCGDDEYGAYVYYEAHAEIVAKLEAKLQPRTVRDVVSFAYIEEMSVRQISDLLTKQHEEITMLRNVVKAVAEQFDGGPDHPWIPGYNAKKIYNKVMLASVPLRSAQSDEPSE